MAGWKKDHPHPQKYGLNKRDKYKDPGCNMHCKTTTDFEVNVKWSEYEVNYNDIFMDPDILTPI